MQLLVSVSSPDEAQSALDGGADIIDAKDPSQGPLGAVAEPGVRSIAALVRGRRPCTAALGDAGDESGIEDMARRWGAAGASFVKVGFAGARTAPRVIDLVAAAVRGAAAGNSRVIAVAYADHAGAASLPIDLIVDAASRGGAAGVLIDTADKAGPGLCDLLTPQNLASLVHRLREMGLFAALAGRLRPHDLPIVRDAGADIAGVRGAACAHGRQGPVIASRVRALRDLCAPSARDAPPLPA
jgi:(5-formylfuran-3-yl)methyl phosphate synthase